MKATLKKIVAKKSATVSTKKKSIVRARVSVVKETKRKITPRLQETIVLGTPSSFFATIRRISSSSVALILIAYFLVTPLTDVYAAEEAVVAGTEVPATVEEQVPETVVEEPAVVEDVQVLETADTEIVIPEPAEVIPEAAPYVPEEVLPPVVPEVVLPDTETATDTPSETATTTPEVTPNPTEETATTTLDIVPVPEVEPVATTPEVIPEVIATTTATSTLEDEVEVPATELVSTHTTEANLYSFGSSECIPVGDGAFHCIKRDVSTEGNENSEIFKDVYSAPDKDGDMEIFHVVDGVPEQLTNNTDDDGAPVYDSVTGDIVWHVLKDDRYQIMQFNRETGVISQITSESYNSMQPSIYDGVVVWQAWKGNNWEIVEKDGEEITELTSNSSQDISPSIQVEYISWQADENGEWKVKIYNRKTKHIETVSGIDGGKIENPRIVLVFDNTKENGDVETVGFDPAKGEAISLVSTPAPLPKKVPVPENQKEEKALIQPVVSPKIETKATTTPEVGNDDPNLDFSTTTPATTLPVATSTVPVEVASTTTPIVVESPVVPDEVVIPGVTQSDIASSTTEVAEVPDTSHITEIVIPPYESATTTDSE